MAISQYNSWSINPHKEPNSPSDPAYMQYDTHAISGRCVLANFTVSQDKLEDGIMKEFDIKMELCNLLIKELFKQNVIEYTMEHRPDLYCTLFRARIFVTPREQTELLRVHKIIK